jgi:hypothetical protein
MINNASTAKLFNWGKTPSETNSAPAEVTATNISTIIWLF